MSEPAKKILDVMKTIGEQTTSAPSQLIKLQIKSLSPLVFKRADRIEIDSNFYILDKNFTTTGLEVGDSVQALVVNDNQDYYIFGNKVSGDPGTSNYENLSNKPSINGTTLVGNKTTSDLGITIPTKTSDLSNDSNFVADASYVHTDNNFTNSQKTKLQGIETGAEVNKIDTIKVNNTAQTITNKTVNISVPTKTSQLTNDSGYITNSVNNLINYTLATDTGHSIELSVNSTTYVVTLNLKNSAGTTISTGTIDLPLESVVVSGSYDSANKKVILTLQNGSTIEFSVADLVAGLQTEITSSNKLSSDLVDDLNKTNKFAKVLNQNVNVWELETGEYIVPSNHYIYFDPDDTQHAYVATNTNVYTITIEKASSAHKRYYIAGGPLVVYGLADTMTGTTEYHVVNTNDLENTNNKVTTISASSTDTQYPSAKSVYDALPKEPKDLIIDTKTYTNILGDSSTNAWANNSFYFGSVRPTSFTGYWAAKYRISVWCEANASYNAVSECLFTGSQSNAAAYAVFNTIYSTSYRPVYYHVMYRLKEAGYTAGYGHALGFSLRDSNNRADSSLPRTVKVELLDQTNCTVTLNDSAVKWSSWTGGTTTNYNSSSDPQNYNFSSNGLQETGDSDTKTVLNITQEKLYVGTNGIYGYNIVAYDVEGRLQGFVTSYSTATTKTKNNAVFRLGTPLYYYNSTTNLTAGSVCADDTLREITPNFNLSYSTNCGGTLTANKSVYLVGIPNGSTFTLADTWWTQTLPTEEDGKIYILLGTAYSTASISWQAIHPIYWYKDFGIKLYTWDESTTSTVEGTTINVTDSSNLPLKDFTMQGNATQDGTPTPDSPVPIHVVTGDNTVEVVGKNFFDKANTNWDRNNISTFKLTIGGASTTRIRTSSFHIAGGNTYVVSGIPSGISLTAVRTYTTNEPTGESTGEAIRNGNVFSIPSHIHYIHLLFGGSNFDDTTKTLMANADIQIEVGSTATSYEPYTSQTQLLSLGSIELAKIGDYRDRIYKQAGKWYEYHKLRKVVFNGDEEWRIFSNSSSRVVFAYDTTDIEAYTSGNATPALLSNRFISASYNATWTVGNISRATTSGYANSLLLVVAPSFTQSSWATWLTDNNVTVWYVLATPTITEITDTTLKGQLESLLAKTTYKNTTNIFTVVASGNEVPTLEVEYYRDVDKTYYENITNKVTTLSATSTDEQYPSAKAVFDLIEAKGIHKIYCTYNDSDVNIANLDEGVYQIIQDPNLTPSINIYYGGSDTTKVLTAYSSAYLFIFNNMAPHKMWFLIYGNDSSTRYIASGYTDSNTGSYKSYSLTSSYLTSISSYVKDNLTYSTSGTTYALSAYQGYLLNQNKEATSNKVTSISSSSTDTQYPSAKLLYDQLGLRQVKMATPLTADLYLVNGSNPSLTTGFYYTNGHSIYINGTKDYSFEESVFYYADLGTGSIIYYSYGYYPYFHTATHSGTAWTTETRDFPATVTSISSSSTDAQVPSAKAVYDYIDTMITQAIGGSY